MTTKELLAFCRRLYPRWDGEGAAARLARFGVPVDVPFGGGLVTSRLKMNPAGRVDL